MGKKQRMQIQKILNHSLELEAQLVNLEVQLQDLEVKYLEKNWRNGNIVIGWHISQAEFEQGPKFDIIPKDKVFSLSSLSSRAYKDIEESAFKNINGPTEAKMNRKKIKKKKKKVRGKPGSRAV